MASTGLGSSAIPITSRSVGVSARYSGAVRNRLTGIGPQDVYLADELFDLVRGGLVVIEVPRGDLDQVDLAGRGFGELEQRGRRGGGSDAGDDDVGRVGGVELDEFVPDSSGCSGDCKRGGIMWSARDDVRWWM